MNRLMNAWNISFTSLQVLTELGVPGQLQAYCAFCCVSLLQCGHFDALMMRFGPTGALSFACPGKTIALLAR
jgi:hypothetical protein